jgi:hypothetical protein
MPGRYAKNEMSSGFLGAIESYAYWPPVPISGPFLSDDETTPPDAPVKKPQLDPIAAAGEGGDHDDQH